MSLATMLLSRVAQLVLRARASPLEHAERLYRRAIRQLERAAELAVYAEQLVRQAEDEEALWRAHG